MVASVDILNKGSIYHMLDGTVEVGDYREYTLGMFLTGLVNQHFNDMALPQRPMTPYLNWMMVEKWVGK